MWERSDILQISDREFTPEEFQVFLRQQKARVINSYDEIIIRGYCYVRFLIMNMRIIEEIEQYIPRRGRILDIGCGFGLFSLLFASCSERRQFISFDLNSKRIAIAKNVRSKLGLTEQIDFRTCDLLNYGFEEEVDAIFVLDLLHHIPQAEVSRILRSFHDVLPEGGTLIIKDVTTKPWFKMVFTWLLDKLMYYNAPLHYYEKSDMISLVKEQGFDVKFHHMIDILPYPHVLYICRKTGGNS